MTRARATDRSRGRSVQTPATCGGPAVAVLACVVLLAVVVAACGPSGPTLAPGSSSPDASGSVTPGGSGVALPTPWPGNSVLGMEALGLADGPIRTAISDLSRGISDEDFGLVRQAAVGLAGLDALMPNMEKIRLNPAMGPFADAYEAAITQTDDAATRLRDAIDARDAPTVTTATMELLDGLAAYTALQPELAAWIQQMPEQKRMYVR